MNIESLHPLVLAYVGDAALEVLVRERLAMTGNPNAGELNRMALEYVTAKKQSLVCDILLEHLTEKEADIFRWAKNAKGGPGPRSVTVYEYRKATGLEAVFGYNRLVGSEQRNRELFDIIYPIDVQ
ncbi:MAG: ribonuclease III [Clostridia bacterium]|nr:ribonuclease III [Clostridia bacterium]